VRAAERCGELLFGKQWQRPFARAVRGDERQIRRCVTGQYTRSIAELQEDLDAATSRSRCPCRTPTQTFLDGIPVTGEKMIAA
jgi:hypothetical protein